MTNRSPIAVFFLSIFTFGIYYIVWLVKTKGEMVRLGADIPSCWLLIIPVVNIYWTWKFAGGVTHVTHGSNSQAVNFVLLWLISVIGAAIIQDSFNKIQGLPAVAVA
jgi:hypothetical protein